jgi:hypothetical protein
MRTLNAGIACFVLGVIRRPLLVPRLGARLAELAAMPFMLVAIVLSARFIARRFALASGARGRLVAGFLALSVSVSVSAERLLAVALQARPLGEYSASCDPVSGSAYLVMLLLFALMPFMLSRRSQQQDGGAA